MTATYDNLNLPERHPEISPLTKSATFKPAIQKYMETLPPEEYLKAYYYFFKLALSSLSPARKATSIKQFHNLVVEIHFGWSDNGRVTYFDGTMPTNREKAVSNAISSSMIRVDGMANEDDDKAVNRALSGCRQALTQDEIKGEDRTYLHMIYDDLDRLEL